MLDRPVPLSRPRPPARKSFTYRNQPTSVPPPTPQDQVLSDSPLNAAARLLQNRLPGTVDFNPCGSFVEGWSEDLELPTPHLELAEPELPSITPEWVHAKTREELESLLLAADRVIRERERDLGIAASIGKSLLENNIALRARQDSLLVRHTPSPPNSHYSRSEYIEGRPPPSPLKSVTNFHSENQPGSPLNQDFRLPSAASLTPHHVHDNHARHSSYSSVSSLTAFRLTPGNNTASPSVLNRLSAQNEALAGELAALEAETSASEQRGKKRLRKLVKELESLRAELHQTEERNRQLEEDRLRELAALQQQQHQQRLEALANREPMGEEDEETESVNERDGSIVDCHKETQQKVIKPESVPEQPVLELEAIATPTRFRHQRFPSQASSICLADETVIAEASESPGERALVSQLLSKISELQETQHEFDTERKEMETKLNKARDEVEALRRQVDEAEEELKEVRQFGDGRRLIGWEGEEEDEEGLRRLSKKAAGNRKMIENRRKLRKKHWPAVEHQATSVTNSPMSSRSVDSQDFFPEESPSPSMRGRPLSFTLSQADTVDEDERQHQRRILRTLGHTSSVSPSIISSEGDGSVRRKNIMAGSNKALGEHRWEEDQEDESNTSTPSPTRPPTRAAGNRNHEGKHVSDTLFSDNSKSYLDSFDGPVPLGSLRSKSNEQTYDELQQAVAELPVAWADEHDHDQSSAELLMIDGPPVSKPRKPESIDWVYECEDADGQREADEEDPWTATRYAAGVASKRSPATNKSRFDHLRRHHRLLMARPVRTVTDRNDDGHSTASNSTPEKPFSDNASGSTAAPRSNRIPSSTSQISRREQALRRLGMASESEYSSGSEDDDDDDEEGSEEEDSWDYIDKTDHDAQAQGASGTDYYPISLGARHAPGMVATRLQVTGTGWKAFVYEWAKLVSVIGLAVGWAVWQGPKQMMGEGVGSPVEEDVGQKRRRKPRAMIERSVDLSAEPSLGSGEIPETVSGSGSRSRSRGTGSGSRGGSKSRRSGGEKRSVKKKASSCSTNARSERS
ncbi:hypothetical protein CROQUDRAFT_661709 [Cronartium quercuum f. sp. fusiforme G11]|uniref:Uncharacterized protein n=1 Tax=Cronartium quercuum f. sp. fusiforme G11 TaxID=708437 RepID=A0A9P6T8H0_9BASI|nr:hypothetical protein CROQUDRAFT_661709 [Cronartium quercuum f. sp. fusiforme G11]